jgi:NTE family protein
MRRNLTQLLNKIPFPYRKPTIGFALSGGSTYGAAHVGVMEVLEENGIQPDMIAGTSAGALVGAAYCAGIPLQEIKTLFLTMGWPTLLRLSIRNPRSIFDTQPMEEFLRKKIGDIEFKDLKIPFAAVACNIHTGERVVLNSGPVAPAVRASAAIPGLFSPVEIDGRLLVDGGIVDNLPVDLVRSMGADYVIASDVSKRGTTNKKPENAFEILLAMIYIMQARAALPDTNQSECYIRPQVSQYSSWGFKDTPRMVEAGRDAAFYALPKLRRNLRLKEKQS